MNPRSFYDNYYHGELLQTVAELRENNAELHEEKSKLKKRVGFLRLLIGSAIFSAMINPYDNTSQESDSSQVISINDDRLHSDANRIKAVDLLLDGEYPGSELYKPLLIKKIEILNYGSDFSECLRAIEEYDELYPNDPNVIATRGEVRLKQAKSTNISQNITKGIYLAYAVADFTNSLNLLEKKFNESKTETPSFGFREDPVGDYFGVDYFNTSFHPPTYILYGRSTANLLLAEDAMIGDDKREAFLNAALADLYEILEQLNHESSFTFVTNQKALDYQRKQISSRIEETKEKLGMK